MPINLKFNKMNDIVVYNTFSGKKESFKTINPNEVKMYVCGPTVYSAAHIGHALSAVAFDVIRRYLLHVGYEVKFVMNFTDVDDKIIARSNKENIDAIKLTQSLISEFKEQLISLNVLPATIYPQATQEIQNMIDFIKELEKKGFAYELNGDVYFRVSKFNNYGKLSKRKVEEQQSGYRITVDLEKEKPEDFALWKSAKEGEMFWQSPWGNGRPGWHIECSAMCVHHLGEQIDIHGGGNDLIFPHHENEIAQSESYSGKQFARYWIHNGMLNLSGDKMSKSIGNLITIKDFLSKYNTNTFRMLVISSLYRNPLSFNFSLVDESEKKLNRILSSLKLSTGILYEESIKKEIETETANFYSNFIKSMNDDFNTPIALSHVFNFVRLINQWRDKGIVSDLLSIAQEKLIFVLSILGFKDISIFDLPSENKNKLSDVIDVLLKIREKSRTDKDFAMSDFIRDQLNSIGLIVSDTKNGSTWSFKDN